VNPQSLRTAVCTVMYEQTGGTAMRIRIWASTEVGIVRNNIPISLATALKKDPVLVPPALRA
jgi:hypothetical protein